MYMDTHDGPSSSFQQRGRGGRNNSSRGGWNNQSGYQGGRNSNRGGGRSNYNQYDNVHPPARGRFDDNRYNDGGDRYSNGSGFGGNPRGGYRGSGRQQPRGRGSWGNSNRGGRTGNYRGGARGGRPPQRHTYDQPSDIEFVAALKGHTGTVTAMAYDSSSSQLYTGSKDETVRLWDCKARGNCLSVVQVGGQVDSLLLEAGYLFVGIRVQGIAGQPVQGLIKVYNLKTGAQHDLAGHQEEIFALAAANGLLLSGGKDMTIRVWQHDVASDTFQPSVAITAAQGGHQAPVQALLPFGPCLVSADWAGAIKLWDMTSGQCMQTIQQAHREPIMRLLQWENVLISCSLDSSIKVWQPVESPTPGAVIDIAPVYVQPPEEAGKAAENWGGVLSISGALDAAQKPLLMASYNDDGCVRLYDLPTFAERGHLPAMRDARALAAAPGDILAAGDNHGTVKLWRWRAAPMPLN
ncbi:g1390 [Coccomyxa elongata]